MKSLKYRSIFFVSAIVLLLVAYASKVSGIWAEWGELTLTTFALVAATYWWLAVKEKSERRYRSAGGRAVIVLQVGRPVLEAVKKFTNFEDIKLVDIEAVLGKKQLDTAADYKKLATEVYRELVAHQNATIDLFISGPVGLNLVIGQLIGLHHFDLRVYQFQTGETPYMLIPEPDRSWLVS